MSISRSERKGFSFTGGRKLPLILVILLVSSVTTGLLVSNYSVMSEDVTVEQAVVVDGTKGSASLDPGLPDGNIVGNGNTSKSWSMAVNVNGTVSTTVSVSGNDSSSVQTHFTDNISKNNGMALIVDKDLVSGSSDKTLDLSSGSANLDLVGPTDTVSDGLRLRTRFPVNYDVTSGSTGTDMEFEINIDASSASLN